MKGYSFRDQVRTAIILSDTATLASLLNPHNVNDILFKEARAIRIAWNWWKMDCIKVCIEAGADVNVVDHTKDYTFLFRAVQWNDLDLMKLLLDAGANFTPDDDLMEAAMRYHHFSAAWILIDYGIDPQYYMPGQVYYRNNVRRIALVVCRMRCSAILRIAMDKNVMQLVAKQIWSMRKDPIINFLET